MNIKYINLPAINADRPFASPVSKFAPAFIKILTISIKPSLHAKNEKEFINYAFIITSIYQSSKACIHFYFDNLHLHLHQSTLMLYLDYFDYYTSLFNIEYS